MKVLLLSLSLYVYLPSATRSYGLSSSLSFICFYFLFIFYCSKQVLDLHYVSRDTTSCSILHSEFDSRGSVGPRSTTICYNNHHLTLSNNLNSSILCHSLQRICLYCLYYLLLKLLILFQLLLLFRLCTPLDFDSRGSVDYYLLLLLCYHYTKPHTIATSRDPNCRVIVCTSLTVTDPGLYLFGAWNGD